MKIEDLSKLQIYEDGAILVKWPMGIPFATIIEGSDFDTIEDCRAAAALIRAAPIMLEALREAVDAHDKALELTLSQIADSGNMVEYIGFPEWYEKAKAAIEAAKNTNETL